MSTWHKLRSLKNYLSAREIHPLTMVRWLRSRTPSSWRNTFTTKLRATSITYSCRVTPLLALLLARQSFCCEPAAHSALPVDLAPVATPIFLVITPLTTLLPLDMPCLRSRSSSGIPYCMSRISEPTFTTGEENPLCPIACLSVRSSCCDFDEDLDGNAPCC